MSDVTKAEGEHVSMGAVDKEMLPRTRRWQRARLAFIAVVLLWIPSTSVGGDESNDRLRMTLERAFVDAPVINRAWARSPRATSEGDAVLVEFFRRGSVIALSVTLQGEGAMSGVEARLSSSGRYLARTRSNQIVGVMPGRDLMNQRRSAWNHAADLLFDIFRVGMQRAPRWEYRFLFQVDRAPGLLDVDIELSNEVGHQASWLHSSQLGDVNPKVEDGSYVFESAESTLTVSPEDGMPVSLRYHPENGKVKWEWKPVKVRRSPAEWLAIIAEDQDRVRRMPSDSPLWDHTPFVRVFGNQLLRYLQQTENEFDRPSELLGVIDILYTVLLPAHNVDRWLARSAIRLREKAALEDEARQMTRARFTGIWSVLREQLGTLTDDEQSFVSTCLWSVMESRMRTAVDLTMERVQAKKTAAPPVKRK